ncbi:MAG TPA: YSC84-related protein [Gammaproteobacteria bacterium]|nr:YSC84-related protein [Gammaproteobacteria bacterium]
MRTSAIVSLVSAAALMGSVGIASAAQTTPPSPSSYQQSQTLQNPSMAMNGTNTGERIASQAAAVLRNSSGTMQSSPSATGTTTTVGNGQIPQQFVNAAHCVVVFPNAYGTAQTALPAGAATGQPGSTTTGATSATTTAGTGTASVSTTMGMREAGIASCRDDDGNWTAAKPAFVKLSLNSANATGENGMSGNGMMSGDTNMSTDTGMQGRSNASTGLAESQNMAAMSDHALVLLFMDDDSADELKDGDITLGDDVDVASGPTASGASDNTAPAAVLAYRGQATGFTGVDVKGAKVDFDEMINKQVYGQDVDPNDLLEGDYNGKLQTHLTAYNQALTQFAPSSQYNSKSSIAK